MKWLNISTKTINRFIAMVVAFTMVFTMGFGTPIVIAENGGTESIITNIAGLNDDVAVQHLEVGASENDIVFPSTLDATLETYKDILVEVVPEIEEVVEEPETTEEVPVEEVTEDTPVIPEEVTETETDAQEETDYEDETTAAEPVVETTEASEVPETAETIETTTETTPAEEPAPAESAPASESTPASEPASDPEPADPVAFIIDTLFPAITVKAAEAGVFAEVSEVTAEIISGETEEEVVEVEPSYVVETITTSTDITIADVTWTLDPAMSSAPEFDSSIEGATYVYTANISSEYVIHSTLPTITVIIGESVEEVEFQQSTILDGVVISVKADKGVFPEGATLSARRATEEEQDTYDNAVEELEGALPVVSSYVFDIKVLNSEGNEIQPDTTKGQVYVSFTLEEAANEELDVNVYHIPDSENGATEAEKLEADINGTTVEAETDSFSIYGITTTATNDVMENDGYPYLVSQNQSSVKLAMKVQAGKETTSSYQWVKKTNDEWVAITGATSREIVLSGDNLVNTAWYACVVNGFDSKPVQMLQAGKGEWTWAWDYSYSWYVSNGQMAYSVDGSGFDIRGKYVKPNGSKYMLNTSYNGSAWRIQKKSGSITDLCFKFDEGDSSAVIISAYLNGCNAFSFGTDTMLGDDDFDYADNAALEATLNADKSLHHVSMIGAKSSKEGDFHETDPAFVITPLTRDGLMYWLGAYGEGWTDYYYAFNEGSNSNYQEYYTTAQIAEHDKKTVVKVNNKDSAMTMSWASNNLSFVSFKFGVGTIAATGAVGGEIEYENEKIKGLKAGEEYEVEIVDGKTVTLTSSDDGTIPFSGDDFDFAGHSIVIRHEGDDSKTLTIAGRPSVDIISTGTQDEGNATRPLDIGTTIISTTTDSITIKVDPSLGQEYILYDNGSIKKNWTKPSDGTLTFTGLDDNKTYILKTRKPATSSAPASLESKGVSITTKGTVSVPQQINQTIDYDGQEHTYTVVPNTENAVVTYSTSEYENYSSTIPVFQNAGTYTVYYKVEKDGYRTDYGSFLVVINKANRFDNNQVVFDETLVLSSDECVNDVVSLEQFLGDLTEDDVVTLVRQGNTSNNIATYTNMTGTISDKLFTYTYPGTYEGRTGRLVLLVENPNYNSYSIVIPVTTSAPIQINLPENNDSAVIYDGRPHNYSVTTDDESAVVKYSTTPDGQYTTTVPSFTEAGTHTVYYTIERIGKATKTGSYTVTVYPNPKSVEKNVTYDGKDHKFPLAVDDKNIKVTYSYTADGEYTDTVPGFNEAGEYVVYYKLEQEGHNPVFGSYTVKINKPVYNNDTNKSYVPVTPIIEEETIEEEVKVEKTETYKPDDSIIKELIPELTETEETTEPEDTLGKGNIIDKGDIWGDMSEDTKVKLLDKLEATGGEIVKTANLLDPVISAKAELKAEENERELVDDKVPVKETPIALVMGEGAVVVTLELTDNSKANAGLADAKAVAKSILTEEQYAAVAAGSILEIKVELTPLEEEAIPELDRQVIDDGVTEYAEQIPNLAMADYIDISMFMRLDDSEWNQLTEVDPIDIVIDIPETHKGLSDTYYIMRAHEGVSTLLEDKDNDEDTITISTGQFSTYALMYDEPQVAVKADFTSSVTACKLCHKCPTLFGICYYVWLAMVAAAGISLVLYKSAKKQTEE